MCTEIVLQSNQQDFLYKLRFSCRNETSVNKQNWNEKLENGTLPSVNRAAGQKSERRKGQDFVLWTSYRPSLGPTNVLMLAQSVPELKVAGEDKQAHRKHTFHGYDSSSNGLCFVKYITQTYLRFHRT